jgi:DNA invertase Pin-like site-specific DNA recombinase
VVWKFDRLGRSLTHLVDLVNGLMRKGVGLQSLQDPIDTTTPHGRLSLHLFAALAEFERDLIRERTHAGLAAARARGRKGGRPKGLSLQAEATACAAETLYREGKLGVQQIADRLGISKRTLYTYLRHRRVPIGAYHTVQRAPAPAEPVEHAPCS